MHINNDVRDAIPFKSLPCALLTILPTPQIAISHPKLATSVL